MTQARCRIVAVPATLPPGRHLFDLDGTLVDTDADCEATERGVGSLGLRRGRAAHPSACRYGGAI